MNWRLIIGQVFARWMVLATVFFSGFVFSAPVEQLPVEIVSAEFGIFDSSNPRETLFAPTRVVPHQTGQRYGWVIEVRTRLRSLSVREEYLLPSQAKPVAPNGRADTVVIPFERHNQVSQRQLVPQEGRIFGEWEIGPGEPAGHRHLQVVIEGQIAASFEYEVK